MPDPSPEETPATEDPEQLELGEETPAEPDPAAVAAAERERLQLELNQTREQMAELRGRVEQQAAQPAQPKPTYTRAQLQNAVDEGKIGDAERDQILYEQERESLRAELKAELEAFKTAQAVEAAATSVRDQIEAYKEAVPDIMREGDLRNRLAAEITKLQRRFPAGTQHEMNTIQLQACENLVGPLNKIKEKTREQRPTHQETGAGQSGSSDKAAPRAPDKIPARIKDHYDNAIRKGIYKGWDDPDLVKEMKYVN